MLDDLILTCLNFNKDLKLKTFHSSDPITFNDLAYPNYINTTMRFSIAITLASLGIATFASAAPTSNDIPNSVLPDGMPNPNKDELRGIELRAQGTLPNSPPQPTISKEGIISLQLIAFAELFEVAFFSELLNNITTNVPGFEIHNPDDRDFALRSLTAILAVGSPLLFRR